MILLCQGASSHLFRGQAAFVIVSSTGCLAYISARQEVEKGLGCTTSNSLSTQLGSVCEGCCCTQHLSTKEIFNKGSRWSKTQIPLSHRSVLEEEMDAVTCGHEARPNPGLVSGHQHTSRHSQPGRQCRWKHR